MDYLMAIDTGGAQLQVSTLENIDTGFYDYINDVLNLHVTTNKGFEKVPVIWLSSERAFQIKNDVTLRDSSGKLRLPIITISRTSLTKDPTFKGSYQAHHVLPMDGPRGYKNHPAIKGRKIAHVKSSEFLENDVNEETTGQNNTGRTIRKKIVYEETFMPIPVYVTVMYSVNIRTEYQQQLNELITPFISSTGQINSFVFKNNGYRYESFIQQDFNQDNNINNLGEEERYFSNKIDVKVLGFLHGNGVNEDKPQSVTKETVVEIKMVGERIVKNLPKDKNYI